MTDEDLRNAWKSQSAETAAVDIKAMEAKMRRNAIDFGIAVTGSSLVMIGLAAMFPNPILVTGAIALVLGLLFVTWEVVDHRRARPIAEVPSIDFQRALLEHRIAFHRRRLWLRVFALLPGGLLFFAGLAMALPRIAPLIYFQIATFIVAIALIVPMNRRAAARLQRQIDDLRQL
jgi:drug/metabolite transporter (DMT)-like permease